jgi:hypothetical protein
VKLKGTLGYEALYVGVIMRASGRTRDNGVVIREKVVSFNDKVRAECGVRGNERWVFFAAVFLVSSEVFEAFKN